jgi:hypothetical protein
VLKTTVPATSLPSEMEAHCRGSSNYSQEYTSFVAQAQRLDLADRGIISITPRPSSHPPKTLTALESENLEKLRPRKDSAAIEKTTDDLDNLQDGYASCTRDDASPFYSAASGYNKFGANTVFPRPPTVTPQITHFRLPELDSEIMRATHPLDDPITYLPRPMKAA